MGSVASRQSPKTQVGTGIPTARAPGQPCGLGQNEPWGLRLLMALLPLVYLRLKSTSPGAGNVGYHQRPLHVFLLQRPVGVVDISGGLGGRRLVPCYGQKLMLSR